MIYLASSWRNRYYDFVLTSLKAAELEVYDFREEGSAFDWKDVDPNWTNKTGIRIEYTVEQLNEMLHHPKANYGFAQDFSNLDKADITILVAPCGRSAHLELGYSLGQKKPCAIFMIEKHEPELMYRMCNLMTKDIGKLIEWAQKNDPHAYSYMDERNPTGYFSR